MPYASDKAARTFRSLTRPLDHLCELPAERLVPGRVLLSGFYQERRHSGPVIAGIVWFTPPIPTRTSLYPFWAAKVCTTECIIARLRLSLCGMTAACCACPEREYVSTWMAPGEVYICREAEPRATISSQSIQFPLVSARYSLPP